MTRKNLFVFAVWCLIPLALSFPAWLSSSLSLSSFGDLYSYHYPLRHLAAGSLQAGHLPFWNPYIFCGLPLSANSQTALFYPVTALSALFPLSLAMTWDYLFHWCWAGLGIFLLARRHGLDGRGGWLLACAYALSPFLVYRITEGIPTLLASLAWVPWCWLALGVKAPGVLGVVWSLQFLSGHPQFMVINAVGMALWAAVQSERLSLLRRLFHEALWVVMLAVIQWMPTYEFMGQSLRGQWPRSFALAYSIDYSVLKTWLRPGALGDPLLGNFADVPSVFFETCGVFIGAVGLLLALAGFISRKAFAAYLLLILGLIMAAGGNNPFYERLLSSTPLGFLRTPARYSLLCLWGLILAAGAGVRRLSARNGAWIWLAALALLPIELALWDGRFINSEESARYLAFNKDLAETAGGKPVRVLTDPELASPNKTMLYRIRNVNGYEAFYLKGYPELAARSEGGPAADASRTYLKKYDSPEMRRAGVAYYLSPEGRLKASAGALPLATWSSASGDAPEILASGPESWTVRGSVPSGAGSARLVISQPNYPGWRAWLDGRAIPIEKHDGFFQSIPMAAASGESFQLRLLFRPTGWPLWVMGSLLAWLAWFDARRRELQGNL